MRALFTIQPGSGHLQAIMPVVDAMSGAGHEVAICSSPSFRPEVEAKGLTYFDAGADRLVTNLERSLSTVEPPSTEWAFANFFAGKLAQQMAPDVLDVARRWTPDVIVRETTEFGGCVAAERLGIPHASVVAGAAASFVYSRRKEILAEPLGRLGTTFGLPPDPEADMPYRYLQLNFLPRRFNGPNADIPLTTHFLRHTNAHRRGETLPDWVPTLADQPTVLATLGTTYHGALGVAQCIVEGLRDDAVNLIVAVGREHDPAALGPQPPNVRIERYVPQTMLLPYCDLFVNHGGFNTLKEGMAAGVPMVIVQSGGDARFGADLCASLGVAQVVSSRTLTAEDIRRAGREVLGNPTYRAKAKELQEEIQALPGPERIVELLESLAAERRPLLAS